MRVLRSYLLLAALVAAAYADESVSSPKQGIVKSANDSPVQNARTTPRLAPTIQEEIEKKGYANVMISMKEDRPSDLLSMKAIRRRLRKLRVACEGDEPDQVAALVEGLEQHAKESHAPVLQAIEEANATTYSSVESLWITNEVAVREATAELLEKLQDLPSVGEIHLEQVAKIPLTNHASVSSVSSEAVNATSANQWSLERIQATDSWAQGFTGSSIRVGVIDSGVRPTHSALAGRMLEGFGWYDGISNVTEPEDAAGHGTSVLSIIAGANNLGVAPEATWLACRACNEYGECMDSSVLLCAQYMLCPFNVVTGEKDCSKRPHVINMSWNYEYQGVNIAQPAVEAWLTAGIVPVISNGNSGSSCGSVNSPADWASTSITVGATNAKDDIWPGSARGPGPDGSIKPDLSAPGADVVAAAIDSDDAVAKFLGTSGAAPFVSGAVALLLQAAPSLTPEAVKELLLTNADTEPLVAHDKDSCVKEATSMSFPNNVYGHGRLNVLKALTKATQA
ncbi:hypothetical protein Poli38472_005987 [Pythium oligandrum]|uniref:subtilisin n=1 Tax=Pythium oligandrum TaxID=41045 RepID=A0A8K1FPM6_PYTOL|nr:hypothetical protein Poli38472_005987 [Pythium oligandrum]|eukprot:TMW68519.1 hypothetical protein Poli38472_005987 [Pythium oligandrum]